MLTDRPFAQPYLSDFSYTPEEISYFYTLFYGITAIFAKYSRKISATIGRGERGGILLVGLLSGVFLVLMVNAPTGLVLVGSIAGINLTKGLFEPLIQDSLNRRITSDKRASCLSIAKMGNNFLGIFLSPLFGYLADALSLKASLGIFQWTFLALLLPGLLYSWRVLGRMRDCEVPGSP